MQEELRDLHNQIQKMLDERIETNKFIYEGLSSMNTKLDNIKETLKDNKEDHGKMDKRITKLETLYNNTIGAIGVIIFIGFTTIYGWFKSK